MSTVLRTISQLRKVEDLGTISPDSVCEISQKEGEKYSSRCMTYAALSADMNNRISASMTEQYSLAQNSDGITINNVCENVNELKNHNITIGGVKTFSSIPKIETVTQYSDPTEVATVAQVDSMLVSNNTYVGSNSVATYPFSSSTFAQEAKWPNLYHWAFGKDGVPDNTYNTNELTISTAGTLVTWGWLADTGTIDPEKAWVGLFGEISCNIYNSQGEIIETTSKSVPLQIQPWIVGSYSSVCQYVGFNVNVQEGLKIKFVSGFRQNPSAQAALQNPGSLTYVENKPCSIFGYVIKKA